MPLVWGQAGREALSTVLGGKFHPGRHRVRGHRGHICDVEGTLLLQVWGWDHLQAATEFPERGWGWARRVAVQMRK